MPRRLRILHFNDVYHAGSWDERNERAARFLAAAAPFLSGDPKPLVVCCGDVLAPSLMSTVTRGLHMMETLELIGVNVGTFGNHDFDFGVNRLAELVHEPRLFGNTAVCSARWVMSNITGADGKPIAGCEETALVDWDGVKVGFIGVSEDWLEMAGLSSSTTNPDKHATWHNDVEAVQRLAVKLRTDGADVVVVMCHSLVCNTAPLVGIPGVDFVLGGHEHIYAPADPARAGWLISGWDFNDFSIVDFTVPDGVPPRERTTSAATVVGASDGQLGISVTRVAVSPDQQLPGDAAGAVDSMPTATYSVEGNAAADPSERVAVLRRLVARYDAALTRVKETVIGATTVPLQAKKFMLRTQETNVGSMLADAFRLRMGADCTLLIGGIISGHNVTPPGPLQMRHVLAWFPWEGNVVLLQLTGAVIHAALEHGVALLPRREGRFPQVSGMQFDVDASQPAGRRIRDVTINAAPLDPARVYSVATNDYVADGGDGYAMLTNARRLVSAETGPLVHDVAREYIEERCVGGGSIAPGIEGRIRHATGFTMDAAEASGRRYVGAYGEGHDTYTQVMAPDGSENS